MEIEKRFLNFVPENERHGHPKSLFTIYFSANMQILTVVTGVLAIEFGLNLFWAIVSILLGNLIGAVFMATHSIQGPRLGIPQMIQSRAQFGVLGAIGPLIIVVLMFTGFFAGNAVLGAQALHNVSSIPINWGIILLCIVCFVATLYGYSLIHKVEKYLALVTAFGFLFITIAALNLPIPEGALAINDFKLAPFMLSVGIFATWQLAYAPYVADYSRYLPSKSKSSKTFIYTYSGTVIGAVWMMALGAVLASSIPNFAGDTSGHIANLLGPNLVAPIYLVIVLGIVGANILNLYGAFMSLITIVESFVKFKETVQTRFNWLFLSLLISGGLALLGQGDFLNNFTNFILFLAYFMFPWTTINLLDYFILRKGKYNIDALYDMNGQYGKFNKIALSAYTVAVLLEIPFINSSLYLGPIAKQLNGVDIAWIVGLIVPGVLYYFLFKKTMRGKEQYSEGTKLSS